MYPGLDKKKAVYKVVNGCHDDGDVRYPFFFEIIAIPYTTKILNVENRPSRFIGTVNYSREIISGLKRIGISPQLVLQICYLRRDSNMMLMLVRG